VPELMARPALMATFKPDIPAASDHAKDATHRLNAELSLMFFDEDILHFRRFAKYVAAFWRIAYSSSHFASWRLRLVFSAANTLSHADEVICCCCLLRQA